MIRGMLILVMFGLVGCGHPTSQSPRDVTASGAESVHSTEMAGDMTQPAVGDCRPDTSSGRVEVLSFHTRRRCPTCRAIEQLTREVVSKTFARQVADSLLVLRVVEIDAEPELSERYRVAWSSLLLQGRDTVVNLTRRAFDTARKRPEEFRATLRHEIENLLAR